MLVVLLAGPGLLVVLTYVSQGQYFGVTGRYGHSLVPAAVAVVATTWRTIPLQVLAGLAVLPHVVISVMTWSSTTPV